MKVFVAGTTCIAEIGVSLQSRIWQDLNDLEQI
jgi:hypothetical protein